MKGFYAKPSILIDLQVLKQPSLDSSQDLNWVTIGSTTSGTTALHWNSDDPLYAWSGTITPVPASPTTAEALRWPAGKIARLRAVAHDPTGDRILTVFDEATYSNCFDDHSTEAWSAIGTKCATQLGPLAIVSTLNNPVGGNFDYLGTVIHNHPDLTAQQTQNYYTAIGAPATLPAFISKYHFASGEQVASYYNEADLGFGRQMHCRKDGAVVACYVKNFGNTSQTANFPANATSALALATASTNSNHTQFATVAMVYNPAAGADAVSFMVYDAADNLATNAQLDSTGQHKSVPSNCLTCHGINSTVTVNSGGVANAGIPTVAGARFLPFDLYSFLYSTDAGFTQAAQEDTFGQLNALVALTPMTSATSQFLKGMYGGVLPTLGTTIAPTNRFIPPDWDTNNSDRTMYEGVVKPYCRGCHMTASTSSVDLDSPSDVSLDIACNASHLMPHAEHTLRRFWNGGARVYLSARYGLQGSGDCSP
ncbi:hypothetical protein DRW03_06095 [Corallococcus sp. H22C18031201]|uniref:hypothetical protein n=1 Tax=Citreicoccus inhibens TaxID=2849499 RepID=UPI000E7405F9|nr:hypothetical protein [Citreicoccus inhibens]MBU8896175.1 hypothetical protein [Citreicoccus inhibens]RJS26031.1 hypothetical protein DRW03_06095 [Corallococcus sp. H22C18031201]